MADSAQKTLSITLNPDGVVGPALLAIKEAAEITAICLTAIDATDFTKPLPQSEAFFDVRVEAKDLNPEDTKTLYKNWLLSRAFQTLITGIRNSLEEAYFYVGIYASSSQIKQTTWGEFQQFLLSLRQKANRFNFPDLLANVNAGLSADLQFEKEFLSLQKARNCLEHRNGVVAPTDLDLGGKVLTLFFPRMKLFYVKDGQEIEIAGQHIVEAGTTITMKRETRTQTYERGQKITFTVAQFHEIAWACFLFAQDLGTKLPKMPTKAAPADQA